MSDLSGQHRDERGDEGRSGRNDPEWRPYSGNGAQGLARVHSVDHFVIAVPDLAVAQRFYEQFGLDVQPNVFSVQLHTHGSPHRWGTLVEGPRKRLKHISFGAYADDMPRFRERMDRLAIERLPAPPGFESNGLWFHDPDGTLVEIKVAQKSSPDEKSCVANPSPPPACAG